MDTRNGIWTAEAKQGSGASLRERLAFTGLLCGLLCVLLGDTLTGHRVLSPSDVVFAQRAWSDAYPGAPAPGNRLLMDPVLQFEPWMERCREAIGRGRLPLWNDLAGCGAPLLANGQSAVFDPFHWIAFFGPMPTALSWMAFAKLLVAGLGMFTLTNHWRIGRAGRWFAGLVFPLSGYMIVWLLYPLTSSAAWLPWILWAIERLRSLPSGRNIALVALLAGLVLVGGHIQTGVHILLGCFLYVFGLLPWTLRPSRFRGLLRAESRFLAGLAGAWVLGIGLAGVAWVPLADYLSRSPTWSDREKEFEPPWQFRKLRWKEAVCWVLPYAYGSQRAGMPNLARGVGAENLNESAGGYAGLATLLWLAPLGVGAGRKEVRVRSLALLLLLGAMASLQAPPLDNLLRALPLVHVMDHRRLTLWVVFALIGLGAFGIDRLGAMAGTVSWSAWRQVWIVGAGLLLIAAAVLPMTRTSLEARARAHYASSVGEAEEAALRAAEQASAVVRFLPAYYASVAALALGTATLTGLLIRKQIHTSRAQGLIGSVVIVDLMMFGIGLNPAIARSSYKPGAPLIDLLRSIASPPRRVLGIGEELPPNLAMRYGLADARNYDSIELTRSLDWFEPIYEPEPDRPTRSSRRWITWEGVARGADRLRRAGVVAVVGATEPPNGLFDRVHQVGSVWVGEWRWETRGTGLQALPGADGRFRIDPRTSMSFEPDHPLVQIPIPFTYESSWQARSETARLRLRADGPFFRVEAPAGIGSFRLEYRPLAVRLAFLLTGFSAGIVVLVCGIGPPNFDSKALGAFPSEALESKPWSSGPFRFALPEGKIADDPLHV